MSREAHRPDSPARLPMARVETAIGSPIGTRRRPGSVGEAARTARLEEGVRGPSSGPGGECVLPIQVPHRRWPSRRPRHGPVARPMSPARSYAVVRRTRRRDGAGLVAGQEHGDALGDAGADQVAGGGAAAIVEEAGRHAGRLTGGAPRRAPAANGDAVAVEDERAVGVAARPPSREGLGNGL